MLLTPFNALAFVAGALATAVVYEIVRRYFERPRIWFAIADLRLQRTRNRQARTLQPTPDLRGLLTEQPLGVIEWTAEYFSEVQMDETILDGLEREQEATALGNRIREYLTSVATPVDLVPRMACDTTFREYARWAFIEHPFKPEELPTLVADTELFPVVAIPHTLEGREVEFLHIDLPGNPRPLIGSPSGDPSTNKKLRPLIDLLARPTPNGLKRLLQITAEYAEYVRKHSRAVIVELERLKDQQHLVYLEIIVTNHGSHTALLGDDAVLHVAPKMPAIKLLHHPFDPSLDPRQLEAVILAERLQRFRDSYPEASKALARAQAPSVRYLTVGPKETRRLSFVSDAPLDANAREAAAALKSGFLSAELLLSQFVLRPAWVPAWLSRQSLQRRRRQTLQR